MFEFNRIIESKLTKYPHDILETFSDEEIEELAEEAIRKRDYEGLNHIIGYTGWNCGSLSDEARERLDVEAIKIVSKCKGFNIHHNIADLINDYESVHTFLLGEEEIKKRQIEILKFLMEANEDITKKELEQFAARITQAEFEAFCNKKGIDLSSAKYRDINVPHYKLASEAPVFVINYDTHLTVVDVVLSKTYSKSIGQEKLRRLYENLLNLDQIFKEMFSYLSLRIVKGDSIKIQFSEGVVSTYAPVQNIISIDSNVLEEEKTKAPMLLVEMIGYYFYEHLSIGNTNPIGKILREQMHRSIKEGAGEFIDDGFSKATHLFVLFNNATIMAGLKSTAALLEKYETAVSKPIYEAAKLLKFDTTAMTKYKFSTEVAEYFAQKSIIDIFYLSAPAAFHSEDELRSDVLRSLLDIYLTFAHQLQPVLGDMSQDSIKKWTLDVFRPKIVEELQLTPKQIFFLESIADYINYNDSKYDNESYDNHFARLMVKYIELKDMGLDQGILDSFNDLVVLHHEQTVPFMRQEIELYKEQCEQCSSSFIQEQAQPSCFEFICIADLIGVFK